MAQAGKPLGVEQGEEQLEEQESSAQKVAVLLKTAAGGVHLVRGQKAVRVLATTKTLRAEQVEVEAGAGAGAGAVEEAGAEAEAEVRVETGAIAQDRGAGSTTQIDEYVSWAGHRPTMNRLLHRCLSINHRRPMQQRIS